MKILKNGDPDKKPRNLLLEQFTCAQCGCEFKLDTLTEATSRTIEAQRHSIKETIATCPWCGRTVRLVETIK